jgi:5'-nucleotidase
MSRKQQKNLTSIMPVMSNTPSTINILISNDDGIFALGVRTLANTLVAAGYDVTVVCPDRERSAAGHGLTIHTPIRAQIVPSIFDPRVKAWSCSGTPADCVKFALSAVVTRPDFVLAGINHGANLGTDVLYSGTVSAAMEGLIDGIPSIALSLNSFNWLDFQPAADCAIKLLAYLLKNPLPKSTLLNVNIPATEHIKGFKITRQGLRRYIENFQERKDPRGKTYYWLAGEVVEEIAQQDSDQFSQINIPTDVEAIKDDYITITPLQYNLTDITIAKQLERINSDDF